MRIKIDSINSDKQLVQQVMDRLRNGYVLTEVRLLPAGSKAVATLHFRKDNNEQVECAVVGLWQALTEVGKDGHTKGDPLPTGYLTEEEGEAVVEVLERRLNL